MYDHSKCIPPTLALYNIVDQNVTFVLRGSFVSVHLLCVCVCVCVHACTCIVI